MTAAADGQQELALGREADAGDHVLDACALHHGGRPPVDVRVPHRPRHVVAGIPEDELRSVTAPRRAGASEALLPIASRAGMTAPMARRRGYVESRVLVEEAERLQREPDLRHGHHGPVLRSRQMVEAERVPEHDILVLDRPILRDVGRQAGAPRCW